MQNNIEILSKLEKIETTIFWLNIQIIIYFFIYIFIIN